MNKSKKVLICLVSLIILTMVIVSLLGTKAFAATGTVKDLLNNNTETDEIIDEGNDEEDNKNVSNKNQNIKDDANNTNNNTNNNINNNANNNTNNNGIPYAGIDNSITFVIIAFGISAVFAYKKIRDYKNI